MKNRVFLIVNLLIIFTGNNVFSKIQSSHHDFKGRSWSNNEICIVCHTPHNALTEIPEAPLWNHTLSDAIYQVYSSPTMDANSGQPSGISKLCLCCHDGSVAYDSHSGRTGTLFVNTKTTVGTDLRNDHPISFDYNSSLASIDDELYDPSVRLSGLGGTISEDLLYNGKMECISCHDVHISRNDSGCVGCHQMHPMRTVSLSLRKDNIGSGLCLTCHKK